MIDETIRQLEARIESTDASISEERRRELRELLEKLRAEVSKLAQTNEEQAASVAGFAQVSTHEATRADQNPQLLKLSLEGLNSSVAGFEKSHPGLVQIVNAVSNTLSNLGI
jgi:hypothetical protein